MDAQYFQQSPSKNRQSAPDHIAYNYVRFPWFVKALLIFEKAISYFGRPPPAAYRRNAMVFGNTFIPRKSHFELKLNRITLRL